MCITRALIVVVMVFCVVMMMVMLIIINRTHTLLYKVLPIELPVGILSVACCLCSVVMDAGNVAGASKWKDSSIF